MSVHLTAGCTGKRSVEEHAVEPRGRRVLLVSTPLPPAICGIGCYTSMLAKAWPGQDETVHLVNSGASVSSTVPGVSRIVEFGWSAASLERALAAADGDCAVVQYAARGYSHSGVPWWMWLGLRRWKRASPERRLTVYFHELWADVALTHRRGILERASRWLARQLAELADVVMTNTDNHKQRLQDLLPHLDVKTIPVGTNILPPEEVPLFSERARGSFVVFGRAFGRLQALESMAAHLGKWHDRGVLRILHVVGPLEDRWERQESMLLKKCLPPAAVMRHGALPGEQVSRLLASTRFALLGQPPQSLMKSTTFMAYASHGCCIVSSEVVDAVYEPMCLLLPPDALDDRAGWYRRAEASVAALGEWYAHHATWHRIAREIAGALPGVHRG